MRQVIKTTVLFTLLASSLALAAYQPLSKPSLALSAFGPQVQVGNLEFLIGRPVRKFPQAQTFCEQAHEADERFEMVRVSQIAKKPQDYRFQMGQTWVWALDDRFLDSFEMKPVGVQVGADDQLFFLAENSARSLWATLHAVCAAKLE